MPQYTYERNVDGTNSATSFSIDDRTVQMGGVIELSEEEHARLSPHFVLTSGKVSEPVNIESNADVNIEVTSGAGDTISEEKSSPSASSKKS